MVDCSSSTGLGAVEFSVDEAGEVSTSDGRTENGDSEADKSELEN